MQPKRCKRVLSAFHLCALGQGDADMRAVILDQRIDRDALYVKQQSMSYMTALELAAQTMSSPSSA